MNHMHAVLLFEITLLIQFEVIKFLMFINKHVIDELFEFSLLINFISLVK